MLQAISIVEAVEAVESYEAYKRIPDGLKGQSFFGAEDRWLYHTENDDRVCRSCQMFDDATFTGEDLRSILPDLTIVSEDMIMVNIHPNCRCYLSREDA